MYTQNTHEVNCLTELSRQELDFVLKAAVPYLYKSSCIPLIWPLHWVSHEKYGNKEEVGTRKKNVRKILKNVSKYGYVPCRVQSVQFRCADQKACSSEVHVLSKNDRRKTDTAVRCLASPCIQSPVPKGARAAGKA